MNITLGYDTRTAYRMARTVGYLRALPPLVVWMLDQTVPSLQMVSKDGSQKTKASFGNLPLKADAIDGSDELYSIIVDAATDFSDQLREYPPVAAVPMVARGKDCSGVPSYVRTEPRLVNLLATEVSVWLIDRIEQITPLPGGDDFFEYLHERMRFWDAVYPQSPRPARLYSRRVCDVCQYRAVEARETPDGLLELACGRCGQVYEGDLQGAFVQQLEVAA